MQARRFFHATYGIKISHYSNFWQRKLLPNRKVSLTAFYCYQNKISRQHTSLQNVLHKITWSLSKTSFTFFKMNITRPYTSRRGQNCNGIKCQNILYNSWRNSQLCIRKKKKVRNSLELMEIKVNVNIIVQERKRNGN